MPLFSLYLSCQIIDILIALTIIINTFHQWHLHGIIVLRISTRLHRNTLLALTKKLHSSSSATEGEIPAAMEVPRHVTLSLTQGEGNHTQPCFPSHTEHFLLFTFSLSAQHLKRNMLYRSIKTTAGKKRNCSGPATVSHRVVLRNQRKCLWAECEQLTHLHIETETWVSTQWREFNLQIWLTRVRPQTNWMQSSFLRLYRGDPGVADKAYLLSYYS